MLPVPLVAQTNGTPTTPAQDVGPSDLSNFSLQGNVTRPAERPSQPDAVVPSPAPVTTAPSTTRPPTSQVEPSTGRTVGTRDNPTPATAQVARPAGASPTTSTVSQQQATPPPTADTAPATPPPAAIVLPPVEEGGWSLLPFFAGMLLAAGAFALFYFTRQRREGRYATAGGYPGQAAPARFAAGDIVPAANAPRHDPVPRHDPTPREVPAPAARKPLPTTLMPKPKEEAAPAASAGIVSTTLRPWLEVELVPDRALMDDKGAAIAFNVTLFNSGAAPARDVSIEACLLNAGIRQDNELSDFFGRPSVETDTIPIIPPQSRVPLRTAVRLTRDQIHEYEVEGRKLFMPLVAVSTRYRWSSGEGQTGAGFLVGSGKAEAEKLAPLRVDQGSRSWNGLGARRYEKGLRR
jgi:hypothetical protein